MRPYYFAFFLVAGITSIVSGQSANQPRKFDEFSNKISTTAYPYKEVTPKTHIDRFVNEIRKRKGSKAYIIVYQGQQIDQGKRFEITQLADQVEWRVRNIRGFDEDNISIIDGGFREEPTLEFWLGPKNSIAPTPTPTVAASSVIRCPSFSISPEGFSFDKSKPIVFSSYVSDGFSPIFNWTVSSGRIVSGQNTKTISVDASETPDKTITAYLELSGIPPLCTRATSRTIGLGKVPFLFDSTENYLYSDLHARIDGYMIALNNNPELTGYIIGYAARGTGRVEIDRALAVVTRIFKFRRYASERVKIVNGGYREFNSVDMWLLPRGATPPKPSPTVDASFIRVLRRRVNLGEW